jgi:hypothetical protein
LRSSEGQPILVLVADVRGVVHDARGPAWTRAVLPLLGLLGMLAGLFWWVLDQSSLGADFFSGLTLLLAGPLLLGRHAPRRARIVPLAGRVEIADAGVLSQVIQARDVVGAASCATADGGEVLALQRMTREAPTLLAFATAEDAKRVRDALGVGVRTSGALRWPVAARKIDLAKTWSRGIGALAAAMLAYAAFEGQDPTAFGGWPLAYLVIVLPLASIATMRTARSNDSRCVWLTEDDVRLEEGRGGWTSVPYASISGVAVEDGWLVLSRGLSRNATTKIERVRHGRRGLSPAELDFLVEGLRGAARRARGESRGVPDATAAAPLARAAGEPARAWLARLETTALQLSRGSTYRDLAFAESDLWAALEDHDADPALRAACARVLSRVTKPSALVRIDAVVAAVRDDEAKTRIRVALEPDLDRAVADLEELDARNDADVLY